MTNETLLLFIVTTALACFTPGPAAMLAGSVGMLRDIRLLWLAIIGIALANVLFFILSAAGIAGLLLASPKVYAAIRWVGAGYLIYLGLRLLFAKGDGAFTGLSVSRDGGSPRAVFAKGFLVEISNPKALLYFSALLPQFVSPSLPLAGQFLTFSLITVALDLLAYASYGFIGFGIARFSAHTVLGGIRRMTGVAFVLAGVRLVRAE